MSSVLRGRVLRLALVAALSLALAACGSNTPAHRLPGEKITLTFWSWVPGIDKVVDEWNAQHPEVHIELSAIPVGVNGGYAKIRAAIRAGDPPDLAQVEYQEIPSFLIDQGLRDLTALGVEDHRDKFVDWQWKQGAYAGGVYAVPQASGPMAMFYRADLLEKWDIEPPRTWDEYAEAAKKVREHDAYITTFPPANSAWFTSLAWQAGARWFGTDNGEWTVDIDNPDTRAVAEYWDGLAEDGLIKTEQDMANGWYRDLQEGEIVSWVGAHWGDALLRGNAPETSGKWRVAPMPQWNLDDDFASANWGGSSTVLPEGGDYPAEALEFAVWLNTDHGSVNQLVKGGYGWPAVDDPLSVDALDREDKFFSGQRYNEVFAEADAAVNTDWQWSPTSAEAFEHLNGGFQAAIDGETTFVDAVTEAQAKVTADMKAKGLPVADE